jgi:hypothetical protein
MTKRLLVATILVALTLPLHADFRSVARALDSHRGVSRVWIPFLGIARAAIWMVEPKGVGDFQLAVFRGADDLDGRELQRLMATHAGPGFTPLVQVRSQRRDEWSFIYAKPSADGKTVDLMILAHDDEDTVLVRVSVDPSVVAREVNRHPRNVTQMSRR